MKEIIKRIGRKALLSPVVRRGLKPVIEFYNNQPAFPAQGKILKPSLLAFHVGGIMPMNDADVGALHAVTEKATSPGMVVVEVGSWTGRSTSVISQVAKAHGGSVYAVDHWQGNIGVAEYGITKKYDIFSIFRNNMELLGYDIHPMVMDSLSAARVFKDNSLDMVFIDADHRYEPVRADIEAWLPKVKLGGIISGHDCSGKYSEQTSAVKQIIDFNTDKDDVKGFGHPGVSKALYGCFNDEYHIMQGSCVWYKMVS